MFFHELEAIAREHPDLIRIAEQLDQRLSGICSPAPLRPNDLSCVIGADENQVVSVFELLAQKGVVRAEDMVECERCQNLMSADALRKAIQDEDEFECSGCDRVFPPRSRPILVYRMTTQALSRTRANAKPLAQQLSELLGLPDREEPLSDRARFVLVAMIELGAVDSDARHSTEAIAIKALGRSADANALKSVMADLNTRKLIDSKTGRGGGCWLTDSGRQRAEKLRIADRNSATV
ncbi:MAG: Rrf2 family transcriptional regulator [Phycisphaerales bacterium]|nr:Rrf2 family transcriptional regulator [Phycisphaerales bacterium]